MQIALFVSAADLKYLWRNDDTTVVNGSRPKSEGASTSVSVIYDMPWNDYKEDKRKSQKTKWIYNKWKNQQTNK